MNLRTRIVWRSRLAVATIAALALAASGGFAANGTGGGITQVLGIWHGTSDCIVKGGPCHDEIVQYRFQPIPGQRDSIEMVAEKLVGGARYDTMGIMNFGYAAKTRTWECVYRNSRGAILWSYAIRKGELYGTLVSLPDRALLRRAHATRGLDPTPGRNP